MGTNNASAPSAFPALAVPKPLALLAPPVPPYVYPILLLSSSAHSCSSLGGRLGGPRDTVPCPGSSPAICHPLARIKRADIPWPPAEMPAGWEGKLRHEAGKSRPRGGLVVEPRGDSMLDSFFLKYFFSPAGTALPLTQPLPARAAPGWTSATAFPRGASTAVPLTAGSSSRLEAPWRALTSRASRRDAGREPTLPSRTLFPRWTGSRTRRDESLSSSSSPPASSWGMGQPLWCPSPRPGGRPRGEGAAGCVQQCGERVNC